MFSGGAQKMMHQAAGFVTRAQWGCDCNDCSDGLSAAVARARQERERAANAVVCVEIDPKAQGPAAPLAAPLAAKQPPPNPAAASLVMAAVLGSGGGASADTT